MAIEIKQLLIKSNVVDEEDDDVEDRDAANANIKHEVLSECRRLIMEMLSDKGLR
jgi:hypothetical protein